MKRIHVILITAAICTIVLGVILFNIRDHNRSTVDIVPDENIIEVESEYIDTDPRKAFRHPEYVKIIDGEVQGYYDLFGDVSGDDLINFEVFTNYVFEHGFKEVTINIMSGGGLTAVAWEICSLMGQMSRRSITVTTQVRSYAGSAAFMVFVAGDNRLVEPSALLMTHKIKPNPKYKDSLKGKTAPLAMLQDITDVWLVARSKVTTEELKEKTDKGDWWFSGKDAVEKWGFADGYIR